MSESAFAGTLDAEASEIVTKASVYLETTIISYLASRMSGDIIVAAHQQLTLQWWEMRRDLYRIYISQLVKDEAARGDIDAAARRRVFIEGIPILDIDAESGELAGELMKAGAIPIKAKADALHVAIAAIHSLDHLLTWNCSHINNAERADVIEWTCRRLGYRCPVICSPEELMGD